MSEQQGVTYPAQEERDSGRGWSEVKRLEIEIDAARDERNAAQAQVENLKSLLRQCLIDEENANLNDSGGLDADTVSAIHAALSAAPASSVRPVDAAYLAALQAQVGRLRDAAINLLTYRKQAGAINFQLEKADEYMRRLDAALSAAPDLTSSDTAPEPVGRSPVDKFIRGRQGIGDEWERIDDSVFRDEIKPEWLETFRYFESAAFKRGAEAMKNQVIALVEGVSGDIGTIDFILGRLRNMPLPEPKP